MSQHTSLSQYARPGCPNLRMRQEGMHGSPALLPLSPHLVELQHVFKVNIQALKLPLLHGGQLGHVEAPLLGRAGPCGRRKAGSNHALAAHPPFIPSVASRLQDAIREAAGAARIANRTWTRALCAALAGVPILVADGVGVEELQEARLGLLAQLNRSVDRIHERNAVLHGAE